MPRGIKRSIEGEEKSLQVKVKRKSLNEKSDGKNPVAIKPKLRNIDISPNQKASEIEKTHTASRAKRKINFGNQSDGNNNAQVVKPQNDYRRSNRVAKQKIIQDLSLSDDGKRSKSKPKSMDIDTNFDRVKPGKAKTKNHDGIQVTIKSDEEELDYEDVMDEDPGSMIADDEEKKDTLATDSDILLGALSATLNDEEMVMRNPHLEELFNKMLDEQIKRA